MKQVEIITSLNDLTISQFEKIVKLNEVEYNTSIESYIDLIDVISNLTKDEIEELDINEFKKIVDVVKEIDYKTFDEKFINEIEIDGVKYKTKSNGTEYNFNVKEVVLLRELIAKNPYHFLQEMIAILFKNVDAEGNIINDLSPQAIEERKNKIGDIKMEIAGPYLTALSKSLLKEK
jgi:hypothetical protein